LFIIIAIHDLTDSGQKEIQLAQDAGLEWLDVYIKETKPHSAKRLPRLLLFLNEVKALSKDKVMLNRVLSSHHG